MLLHYLQFAKQLKMPTRAVHFMAMQMEREHPKLPRGFGITGDMEGVGHSGVYTL